MTLKAVIGSTHSIEPREAGSNTARQVFDQPGQGDGILGILFVSGNLAFNQVLNGVATLLGGIPIIGCSVAAGITQHGLLEHGAQLALLTGEGVEVAVNWQPEFNEDSETASRSLLTELKYDGSGSFFVCADGFGGDAGKLAEIMPEQKDGFAGVLAASDIRLARSFQAAGGLHGFGGIAGAVMRGNLVMGAGQAHGWLPSGAYFKLTGVNGPFIVEMDNKSPASAYASLFGYAPEDWTSPPLDQLVRMYPLGIERGADLPLLVRSPLRMEINGLLRMHTPVREGELAHVMVGSAEACVRAVEKAAREALAQLHGAQPVCGLVLVDVAWRQILQSRVGIELQAVRRVLEAENIEVQSVPLMGAYVYGQFGRGQASSPELFNQHVQVVLFGAPK